MDEKKIVRLYSEKPVTKLKGMTIGLVGELGTGKTYLVRKVLAKITENFIDQVSSPTFNLCNVYEAEGLQVNHFDLYRLENEEDLYNIGLWESVESSEKLNFIEWVDLYPDLLQRCDHLVEISITTDGERAYKVCEKKGR